MCDDIFCPAAAMRQTELMTRLGQVACERGHSDWALGPNPCSGCGAAQ